VASKRAISAKARIIPATTWLILFKFISYQKSYESILIISYFNAFNCVMRMFNRKKPRC
jgi:hypothetical protein